MERLGLGPEVALSRNPGLVFGRMTGWGQHGPLAPTAGHDLNYIALSGALASLGRAGEKPAPPLSLIGDFAGGALYLALGILGALLEAKSVRQRAGCRCGDRRRRGLVDDCFLWSACRRAIQHQARHKCARWRFGHLRHLRVRRRPRNVCWRDRGEIPFRTLQDSWHRARGRRPRASRENRFSVQAAQSGGVVQVVRRQRCLCGAGSLLAEAPNHPHNRQRDNFIEVDGVLQPAPAPRFSRTVGRGVPTAPETAGQNTREVLEALGLADKDIAQLAEQRVIRLTASGKAGGEQVSSRAGGRSAQGVMS